MSGYWPPSAVGVDPRDYDDGEVPVKDDATGLFVPGAGGSVAVDDDAVEVVETATRLNFGEALDVTDVGGGVARIDSRLVVAVAPPAGAVEGTVFVSQLGVFFDTNGDPL